MFDKLQSMHAYRFGCCGNGMECIIWNEEGKYVKYWSHSLDFAIKGALLKVKNNMWC